MILYEDCPCQFVASVSHMLWIISRSIDHSLFPFKCVKDIVHSILESETSAVKVFYIWICCVKVLNADKLNGNINL
jgi:hypothetical protein